MSYRPSGNYNLDVRRGLVAGHSMVGIRGHDPTVPNGGPFTLSPQFGGNGYDIDQSVIAVTPAVVGVASTDNTNDNVAGTGALTALVIGLDAAGAAQTEVVTMTGQTAVNTVATFSAIHSIVVLTTGANNKNVGTIYIGTGTFTAGVPAVRMCSMEISHNISASGYYVVPAGKTLYLQALTGTTAANKDVEVFIEVSKDGILWTVPFPIGVQTGFFFAEIKAAPGNPAGDHVRISALANSASTDVTFIIEGELVDD